MSSTATVALLFLHALPLDGTMWKQQQDLCDLPVYAPTLYGFGNTVEAWAKGALDLVSEDRVILVGNSIGGSCALEITALAPERVEAMVLVGTKADRTPNPDFLTSALKIIESDGPETAWETYWQPLFSARSSATAVTTAKEIYDQRTVADLVGGTTAFHTRPSRKSLLQDFPRNIAFVTGAEDIAPGPEISLQQAKTAKCGQFHIIPDCGHYAPLEAPHELNEILKQVISPVLSAAR